MRVDDRAAWPGPAAASTAGDDAVPRAARGVSAGRGTSADGAPVRIEAPFLFDSIAALSPDAIICADERNVITFWNRAAEAIFGYSGDEAIGRSLSLILPAAMRAGHERGLARIATGQSPRFVGQILAVTALRRDGTEFPVELSLTHWTESGHHFFGAIIRDITDRRAAEEQLRREADYDHLTGVANRKLLERRMREASEGGRSGAVIVLDLDGFKDVNDNLGHASGDHVLKEVAARLQSAIGPGGLVARLGGDEFAVFLDAPAKGDDLVARAERLVLEIERVILFEERCIYVGAGAGLAVATRALWSPRQLLDDADLALYRAKGAGWSHVRLFTDDLRSVAQTRVSISSDLRGAWDRQEFALHFQPQVRLGDGRIVGAEALLRWNHPDRGLLSPAAFLGVLETSLLADPVSEWILRSACAQARRLREVAGPEFRVGVNLFPGQFMSGTLPRLVERALAAEGLPGRCLELEITENTILRSDSRILRDLRDLRAMGVGIAFDDYGTGYASLTMLKTYPVTRLKIDRSFVATIEQSRADQVIVESVAQLARGFDLQVTAEGIETAAQARLLARHVAEGQGYLFGRPMPMEGLLAALAGDGPVRGPGR